LLIFVCFNISVLYGFSFFSTLNVDLPEDLINKKLRLNFELCLSSL
jgi:hypothetical protein